MLKNLLFFLFLYGLLFAQNLPQTVALADSQYRYGQYGSAAALYRRALFFDRSQHYAAHCAQQLAWCEASTGHYPEALRAFEQALALTADSVQLPLVLGKSAVHLAAGSPLSALESLNFYRQRLPVAHLPALYPSVGAAWFALHETDSAFHYFRLAAGGDSLVVHRLDSLEQKYTHQQRLKPGLAGALSLILPGSGQLYAGNGKNAANSLLLVGGLLSAGIWMAVKFTPLDAILTVFPWFWRYYQGGVWHARDLVRKKKQAIASETLNSALTLLRVAK